MDKFPGGSIVSIHKQGALDNSDYTVKCFSKLLKYIVINVLVSYNKQ